MAQGRVLEYVKNPDYFVKGRPYLDGKYVVIKEPGTRIAALQTHQVDVSFPNEVSRRAEQLKAAVPSLVITVQHERQRQHRHEHQEAALRQPEGAARGQPRHRPRGLIQAVHQGGESRRRHGAEALRRLGPPRADLNTLTGYKARGR